MEIKPIHLLFVILLSFIALFTSILFQLMPVYIIALPLFLISLSTYLLTFIPFPLSDLPVIWGLRSPLKSYVKNVFLWGLGAFITGSLLMFLLSVLGLNDSALVSDKIESLPWYVLLYAVTLAPISEEIFFRKFLPSYIGGFLSSLLFAFAHLSYGSISELIGAFYMGYYFYLSYLFTGDLKVPITLHVIVNTLSLISVFLLGG